MPVEFSVAGFRLGHSMVRPSYDWNRRFPGVAVPWTTCSSSRAWAGPRRRVRLLSNWLADWRRMYDFPAGGH